MKKYIFITNGIGEISGGIIYIRNKLLFLRKNGWKVSIIYAIQGNIRIQELQPFQNQYGELEYYPAYFNRKELEHLLKEFANIIGEAEEYVIESHDQKMACWGELLAARIHARHMVFLLDEQLSIQERSFFQFFDFKHKNKELYGICEESLPLLFKGWKEVPKEQQYKLNAYCSNCIEDIESEWIDCFDESFDYHIATIGRLEKIYIPVMLEGIKQFCRNHPDKTVQVLLLGGTYVEGTIARIHDLIKDIPQISMIISGFIYPIPLQLIKKVDVVVACSGAAQSTSYLAVPTICMDLEDGQPIGILGVTTNNWSFRTEEDLTYRLEDLLEMILMKQIEIRLEEQEETDYMDIFTEHIESIPAGKENLTYYDTKRLTENKRNSWICRVLGFKRYVKLKSWKYKKKELGSTNPGEDQNNLKKQVLSGLFWRFAERCGSQGVSFIVSIILARILLPKDYGTIALVTVFTAILQVFIENGLGNSLIQKKDADDLDFSTVFYFNMLLCFVLYLGMFAVAPLIAAFYRDPQLTLIVRILSLTLIISGVKNIQQAYISSHMQFRLFFYASLAGIFGSAVVGIVMAYRGCGVWALVAQQIVNGAIDTAVLWTIVNWRPRRMFSIERLKGLASYGWKLLVSGLVDTIYNNLQQMIIGRIYSPQDLAYYNKGKQMPNLLVTNINTSIDSVLLPAMSKEQDDPIRIKAMTRRAIQISSYIMWPLMVGLSVVAEPLIRLLLTEKWMICVPYLRIFCVTFGLWPIHTANLNAIKAVGRSDLFLKLEIIKKVVGMIVLVIVMRMGVLIMAASLILVAVASSFINAAPNKKLLDYGYLEQIKDILPSLLLAVVMGACVYPILFFKFHSIMILSLQIVAGIVIYVAGSKLLHVESYEYIVGLIKHLVKQQKGTKNER